MTTSILAAAELADQLDQRRFGWTLARGRIRPEEPPWGFQIVRLYDGLDTSDDPPLVVENACPLECVRSAGAKLAVLDEWVASPITQRVFRVLHRTYIHDQPYTVRRLRAVAGDEERWLVHDCNDQPTIVINTDQWHKAITACEAVIAKIKVQEDTL